MAAQAAEEERGLLQEEEFLPALVWRLGRWRAGALASGALAGWGTGIWGAGGLGRWRAGDVATNIVLGQSVLIPESCGR